MNAVQIEQSPLEVDLARRVESLDLQQKIRLLTGADFWALNAEPAVGLRRLVTSDGPAGVRGELWDERDTSANIPSPTALAASWDDELVGDLGRLLAAEARRKGVDVVLAPTVNLHRSPYGGRHFECLSEDPVLTGRIGGALVHGLQSEGVGATVKHFVANDSETNRYTADMKVDERTLHEVYLAPFETIVRDAGVWAVMAAYNSTNGSSMTHSPLLLDVLHGRWDFDGVTMTDWYAGRTTEAAANAGLDLIMPGPTGPWGERLLAAVRNGQVDEHTIDDKVLRLLRLAGRVGALDDAPAAEQARVWPADTQLELLRRSAASGFVLVRNEPVQGRAALPLDASGLSRLAMIGPNALEGRTMGGGSALVFTDQTVSPLEGIRSALSPQVQIDFSPGVRAHTRVAVADSAHLTTPDGTQRGVELVFRDADEQVLGTDVRTGTAYNWNNAFGDVPVERLASIELRTRLRAPLAGDYTIGTSGIGRFAMTLDGAVAFDEALALPADADPVEGLMRPPQRTQVTHLDEGQSLDVVLRHVVQDREPGADLLVSLQLNIDLPYDGDDAEIDRAVELAAQADVAVVVVGTNEEVESEGFDRVSLALPGRQDELVRRVAAANPRTVVVVNSGSPVLLPWREEVAACLLTWFPGQEFGTALADVLLGEREPGGRLPTTWPADESAPLPATKPVDGVVSYDEGIHIGYRRFLREGVEPAYWFGHGLGYTTWDHRSLAAAGSSVTVGVRNSGERAGREIVQVYLSKADSQVDRPVRWLAGYAAVTAGAGQEVQVRVELPRQAFSHWDVAEHAWVVEPGTYRVEVGRSAGDLTLGTDLEYR